MTTRLISTDEWLALYRSLGWDAPEHHMHDAYTALLAEPAPIAAALGATE